MAIGRIEWLKEFSTSEHEVFSGIATDNNGNIYTSGDTEANLDGQNSGTTNAWVAKYDTDGNLLWTEQLGTPGGERSYEVATDSNSNVYISGITNGSLGSVNAGYLDAWIAKYDTHGNLIWTRQLGTSGSDESYAITTDNNDNVYISGITGGSLGDTPNKGSSDAWIAKYNTNGDLLWTKQLGTPGLEYSYGIATDNNNNVYISGSTEGSLNSTQNAGNHDAWIAKYNTHGDLLWTRQFGTPGFDYSYGIATDNNGNTYITGNTSESFPPNTDSWVAKYDTHGNLLWTREFSTPGFDYSFDIDTDNNGNVYISGYIWESSNGINPPNADSWIAKYDSQGNLLWTKRHGYFEYSQTLGLAVDNKNNAYVSGITTKYGERGDAWVAKISECSIANNNSHNFDHFFKNFNRFQNKSIPGTYLFAGPDESLDICEYSQNLIAEGLAFKAAVETRDDLIHMNRFQNSNIPGTYLYAGEEESKSIREKFPNFIEEGIAFYVYPGSANIGVDFYRFQNLDVPGTYILVGPEERQNILDNYPNFVEEGIAFEVEI